MTRAPLRVGVVYDFRNPPESGIATPRLYAEILDQVAWLDGLGLDLVWFTEHHFVDDGYLPSWIPVAGAMAARTRRVRFSSDICLLPFNHPGPPGRGPGRARQPERRPRSRSAWAWATRRTSSAASASRCPSACRARRRASRCCAAASPASGSASTASATTSTTSSYARATCSRAGRRCGSPRCPRAGPSGRRASTATCCRRARATRCWSRGATRCGPPAAIPAAYRVGIIRGCLVTDDRERDWPAVRAAERYRGQLYARFFAESGRFQPVDARRPPHPPDVGGRRRRALRGRAVGVRRRARHHRPRHLGGAAGTAARADEREPRALRPRRGAALEGCRRLISPA